VLLTICIEPPPTSFLNLTSARSGSTPVVSQSIMKPMVPVGASTLAWALRQPLTAPISRQPAHSAFAASRIAVSNASIARTRPAASACLRITRVCGSALTAKPLYGPTTPASSAERRYAVPVIRAVMAAAMARPPSESYAWPVAISSAPRLA
jgi:hypothetical protein